MDILKFLKKEDRLKFPEKKGIDIPPAPPIKEALPSFSEEDIMAIKEAVEKPKPKPKPVIMEPPEKIIDFETEAVASQKSVLAEREHLELTKPIFVNVDVFREVIDEIALIQNSLKETGDSLSRLGEFKEDEDKEFRRYAHDIQDVQKKLIYVDKTLFG